MVGRGTIDNFDNNGKVAGIKVDNATIKYMNNQKDIISSATDGIFLHAGTIDSFDNSGVITGNQNGIRLEKNGGHVSGTIKTLNNTGSIIGINGYGINVVGSKDSFHTLNNQGYIYGKNSGIYVSGQWGIVGKISTIKNQGTIIGSQYGIHLVSFNGKLASTIENIFNEGTILGQISGIHLNAHNQYIDNHILLQGPNALIAGGKAGIHNKGTIGVNNNNGSLVNNNTGNVIDLKNGATIASLKQEKDALKYDESGTAILNEGTIKGNINLDKESKIIGALHNKNTIGGNISLNNKSYISSINNEKNIQGSIDLKEQSHINSILNNGTIEKGISLDKSTIGTIVNTGIIGNEASPLATQDITYGINNSGTIEKLINSSGDINNPNTDKDIHIY
ncbi:hypothetical protein, partial [Campylobacter armoricus]|uniref:hypothetical protein n=2 Tax=Campylobacter armoricus TaxID=2505970 RepID=UPI00191BF4F3